MHTIIKKIKYNLEGERRVPTAQFKSQNLGPTGIGSQWFLPKSNRFDSYQKKGTGGLPGGSKKRTDLKINHTTRHHILRTLNKKLSMGPKKEKINNHGTRRKHATEGTS